MFEYEINDKKYYVPNIGYQLVIIDFGNAVDLSKIKGKEARKEVRKDYNFFFNNHYTQNDNDDDDVLLYRKGDIQEIMYQNYSASDIISVLKKNDKMYVIEQALRTVRKKFRNDISLNGDKDKLMNKIRFELCKIIGRDVKLYKLFDPTLKMIYKILQPKGIVGEFNKLFNENRLFNKCDNCDVIERFRLTF